MSTPKPNVHEADWLGLGLSCSGVPGAYRLTRSPTREHREWRVIETTGATIEEAFDEMWTRLVQDGSTQP